MGSEQSLPTKPKEKQLPLFVNETKNAKDDLTECTDGEELSQGTNSLCTPQPGDDTDPRNPEFWRKQHAASKDKYYLDTLRVAAECGELDMWCGQFAQLTFDMTQDYDTIINVHDLVHCAIRVERSLYMTNQEYWMRVPSKRLRYIVACYNGSRRDEYGWMDQIPGCPKNLQLRRQVHTAIWCAALDRKDVPNCKI